MMIKSEQVCFSKDEIPSQLSHMYSKLMELNKHRKEGFHFVATQTVNTERKSETECTDPQGLPAL